MSLSNYQVLRLHSSNLECFRINKNKCTNLHSYGIEPLSYDFWLKNIYFTRKPLLLVFSDYFFDLNTITLPSVLKAELEYFVAFELKQNGGQLPEYWCFATVSDDGVETTVQVAVLKKDFHGLMKTIAEYSGCSHLGLVMEDFLLECLPTDLPLGADKEVFYELLIHINPFEKAQFCPVGTPQISQLTLSVYFIAALMLACAPLAASVNLYAQREAWMSLNSKIEHELNSKRIADFDTTHQLEKMEMKQVLIEEKLNYFSEKYFLNELFELLELALGRMDNAWIDDFVYSSSPDFPIVVSGRFILKTRNEADSNEMYRNAEQKLRFLCDELRSTELLNDVSEFSVDYSFLDQQIPIVPFKIETSRTEQIKSFVEREDQ